MPFITFGRVLFAVLFIYLGAKKLFDIQATAELIADKVTIPRTDALCRQAPDPDSNGAQTLLAILIGGFEVIAGLMIALNFGARFFAILLIILVRSRPTTFTISGRSRRRTTQP